MCVHDNTKISVTDIYHTIPYHHTNITVLRMLCVVRTGVVQSECMLQTMAQRTEFGVVVGELEVFEVFFSVLPSPHSVRHGACFALDTYISRASAQWSTVGC